MKEPALFRRDDEAVYLAHEIEWMHAIDRCRINGRFRLCRGSNAKELRRQAIGAEFDPHAATELADLIERRMRAPADNSASSRAEGAAGNLAGDEPISSQNPTPKGESQ